MDAKGARTRLEWGVLVGLSLVGVVIALIADRNGWDELRNIAVMMTAAYVLGELVWPAVRPPVTHDRQFRERRR